MNLRRATVEELVAVQQAQLVGLKDAKRELDEAFNQLMDGAITYGEFVRHQIILFNFINELREIGQQIEFEKATL